MYNKKNKSKGETKMDDFVIELERNKELAHKKKHSKYRDVLKLIANSDPTVENIICDNDGDIKFSVKRKDLGITYDILLRYKKEIICDFMADFIGEFLIRENLDGFAKVLTGLASKEYMNLVYKFEHRKFGMHVSGDYFVFTFHISLLQTILLEGFKKSIKDS